MSPAIKKLQLKVILRVLFSFVSVILVTAAAIVAETILLMNLVFFAEYSFIKVSGLGTNVYFLISSAYSANMNETARSTIPMK